MSRDIVALIDGAIEDYETSDDAARFVPEQDRWERPSEESFNVQIHIDPDAYVAMWRHVEEAMSRMANQVGRFAATMQRLPSSQKRAIAHLYRVPLRFIEWDPPKLCIDGREYYRRQQARRRRR